MKSRVPAGIVLGALLWSGCGGSSSPTQPSQPTYPSIAGVYRNGTALWQYDLTRIKDGATAHLSCGGSATLTQAVSTIGGSFQIVGGDCDQTTPQTGTFVNGAVRIDGGINFGLSIPGSSGGDALATIFSCVPVSGDSALNGAVTGTHIDAKQAMQISCPTDGIVNITLRLVGDRS